MTDKKKAASLPERSPNNSSRHNTSSAHSRPGRGRAKKTIELMDAATDILSEIKPANVRAVCYRLFVSGHIESMAKTQTQKVSRILVMAREEGMVPWGWIVDEIREPERITTWRDPEDIIDNAVRGYRRDYWQDQPERVEVWSEKGTIRGTLAPVLDKYGVTFRVMHGYTSATSIQSAAVESLSSEKPLTILYVGDWDPSGLHMSMVDVPGRLRRYGGIADVKRIALNHDDVSHGNLPSFKAETKKSDTRYQWFVREYGRQCWELDALPPPTLRSRVEDHIRSFIDLDAWDHAIMVERAETESMRDILGTFNSILRPVEKYSGGDA